MHIRVEYRVRPDLKFLANLDMLRLLERSLRRAGIPYKLSQGFNPHPRLSVGTVLPVGVWGEREYFDLELATMPEPEFMARMNAALPPGITVTACREIEPDAPSLMKMINAAEYAFLIRGHKDDLLLILASISSQEELIVQSHGKNKNRPKDLRPGIYALQTEPAGENDLISALVSVNEPVNVRFDEILELLNNYGIKADSILDFWRRGNYVRRDGMFLSPLEYKL